MDNDFGKLRDAQWNADSTHPPPSTPTPTQVTAHYNFMSEFKIKSSDMQQASYQTMENDFGTLRDVTAHYDLMSEFKIKSSDMQQASYQTMENDYGTLRDAQWNADSNRDMTVALFKADLEQQVDVLNKEVVDIGLLASHDMIFDWSADIDTVTDFTAKLLAKRLGWQGELEDGEGGQPRPAVGRRGTPGELPSKNRQNASTSTRGSSSCQSPPFRILITVSEDVSLRHLLWTSRASWEETTDELRCKLLLQVEPAELEEQVEPAELEEQAEPAELEEVVMKMHKTVHKIERGLAVVPMLRDSVNTWREFYPVVQYLRNPNMKERHWGKPGPLARI
eukprot:gene2274-8542_t